MYTIKMYILSCASEICQRCANYSQLNSLNSDQDLLGSKINKYDMKNILCISFLPPYLLIYFTFWPSVKMFVRLCARRSEYEYYKPQYNSCSIGKKSAWVTIGTRTSKSGKFSNQFWTCINYMRMPFHGLQNLSPELCPGITYVNHDRLLLCALCPTVVVLTT